MLLRLDKITSHRYKLLGIISHNLLRNHTRQVKKHLVLRKNEKFQTLKNISFEKRNCEMYIVSSLDPKIDSRGTVRFEKNMTHVPPHFETLYKLQYTKYKTTQYNLVARQEAKRHYMMQSSSHKTKKRESAFPLAL